MKREALKAPKYRGYDEKCSAKKRKRMNGGKEA
jgi:hypothetical protein